MRRLTLLAALVLLVYPVNPAFAQSAAKNASRSASLAPTDPSQHQSVIHALNQIRERVSDLPVGRSLGKDEGRASSANDATSRIGGISGFVFSDPVATDSASAWVLAVPVNLIENPTGWQTANVDYDGSYSFVALDPGAYILMAGAAGAQSQFFPHAYTIEEAQPVEVVSGAMQEGIDFWLEPLVSGTGSITGSVTAATDSLAIEASKIYAFAVDSPYQRIEASTNADGTYELNNLFAGRYIVQASAPGYFTRYYDNAATQEQATTVSVAADAHVAGIDFELPVSGSISGTVTDQDGSPIARAEIYILSDPTGPDPDSLNGYFSFWTQTNDAGEYTVSGLTGGEWFVQAQTYTQWFAISEWYDDAHSLENATPVVVAEGSETSGINFVLDLAIDTGRVTGRVTTADGQAVGHAYLHAETFESIANDSTLFGDSLAFYVFAYAETDVDGYFVFDDIPAGAYRIALDYYGEFFSTTIWYDQAYYREEATPVNVAKDETTDGVDFQLPRADGVIEGTVTGNDGNPIANAFIRASTGENFYPIDLATGFGYAYAVTDVDGKYTLTGLIDGDYYVSASFCMFYNCIERWWPNAATFPDALPVIVAGGGSDPATVDFMLPITQGSAALSGSVSHLDGRAIHGAYMSLSLTSDALGDSLDWFYERGTATDSSGAYTFANLPAGDYTVSASYWEEGGYALQWYDGADSRADATIIMIADGDVRDEIDFVLDLKPNYGTLAGHVWIDDAQGDTLGVERAYVEVSPFYWDYSASMIDPTPYHAITDATGAFEIDSLASGPYFVKVYSHQGIQLGGHSDEHRYAFEIIGGEMTNVDVVLMRIEGGDNSITGTVRSSDGADLDIAVVRAVLDEDVFRTYTAISNPDGSYKLQDLPPGEYVLWSFAPYHTTKYYDNAYDPAEATRIHVTENEHVGGIDFDLETIYYFADRDSSAQNSAFVYGKVTDNEGAALAEAIVYAMDGAGQVVQSVRTRADGMYEIVGLAPRTGVRLKATLTGYVSRFHDGAERLDASADLMLSAGRFEINLSLQRGTPTGSDRDRADLPTGVTLLGNYPNPFDSATQLVFTISQSADVALTVYDALGRQVTELHAGTLSTGEHRIRWDATRSGGESVTSGLYFYRITAGEAIQTGRMTVLR